MKIAVVSQNNSEIKKLVEKYKFEIVKKNPEIVICAGGDGTILLSERLYPFIPKLVIKTSKTFRKYDYTLDQLELILELIKQKKYKIIEENKIEAEFKGEKLVALNEIQVRQRYPNVALRFSISVNGKTYKNLIGDGVIVSTPFGSTGYYKSAGGKRFTKGIGIVFNNLYSNGIKNLIVNEKSKIKVRIERELSWLIRDNDKNFINLKPGDEVIISLSKNNARFIKV
ncbi:MAG: hypothetical protein QXO27_04555 [Candidatus Aenigmatarchaeota archaeon]